VAGTWGPLKLKFGGDGARIPVPGIPAGILHLVYH